jgi:GNAT superfamily N-acetyltransferase
MKNKRVIGVTGIYTLSADEKDSAWLAYYCVDKRFRKKGYGTKLLDFIINLAKDMGKDYLKLYTSYNQNIKNAMNIYEKRGFKIDKIKNHPNTNQEMVFMTTKL